MKKLLIGAAGAAVLFLGATGFAAAEQPEFTDGFVCPVLGGQAGQHGNAPADVIVQIGGGDYSVIGPDVTVPIHATNDNGDGDPGSADHASPGDPDYSAIWATP